MNVFEVRSRLVADYAQYISGFIHIRDQKKAGAAAVQLRRLLEMKEELDAWSETNKVPR